MANSSLGNIFSRLQGLKNVSGRRVMPGAEVLQELEEDVPDVSGVSNDIDYAGLSNLSNNVPEVDTGGELTSQSYDVRANREAFPEQENILNNSPDEGEVLRKLGAALALNSEGVMQPKEPSIIPQEVTPQTETPPIETAQVDIQEGIPPVTASEQAQIPTPPNNNVPNEIPKETREPGTYVELGAAQQLYNDINSSPELKLELERIFDTKLNPERANQVKEFEKVVDAFVKKLEGVDTALTTRENQLLDKVSRRDLSTSEQISMALALVAPAIIAGLFAGKAGVAGGLAAGGANVVSALAGRQKELKEADELLPEIALEKSKIAKEKMVTQQQSEEVKKKIRDSIPNNALRQLFTRDGMIINGKLVLNTGNPLLPLKSTAVRTEKDFDTFREKTMPDLANKVSTTEQGLHLLDNLNELIEIAEKQKEGVQYDYIPFYDTVANAFKALVPAGRDTFVDENGNQVKISELYEATLEQLSDMYSQTIGAAGSKTAFKTYREHFREMIANPFSLEALAKGRTNLGTVRSQIDSVKNKFEDSLVKNLDASGVETTPVKELFKNTKLNTSQSEATRKKNRANEAVKQTLGK